MSPWIVTGWSPTGSSSCPLANQDQFVAVASQVETSLRGSGTQSLPDQARPSHAVAHPVPTLSG